MVAHPLPASIRLDRGENVEPGLEPFIKSLGDFYGFMHGVLGGLNPIHNGFAPFRSEVRVQLEHGRMRRNQVGPIHLYFIVILPKAGAHQNSKFENRQNS